MPGPAVASDLPERGLDIIGLTNVLSTLLEDGHHPRTLVWLTEFGMWGDLEEAVGRKLWTQLLRGYRAPEEKKMEDAPGLLFDEPEIEDQRAFLTVLLVFQWDAMLVPEHGSYFVRISHDGYVRFAAKDERTAKKLTAIADGWKNADKPRP